LQISIDLGILLQLLLIVLVAIGIFVAIQLVVILWDIRQVTKKIRKVVSVVNLAEYFVDEEDLKAFLKKCRRAWFKIFGLVGDFLSSLLKGGKKNE
jgi:hypothetical protein